VNNYVLQSDKINKAQHTTRNIKNWAESGKYTNFNIKETAL